MPQQDLLPAGVCIAPDGQLMFATPAHAAAYRQAVASEHWVCSAYLIRHWLPTFGSADFKILAVLQNIASEGRVEITIPQLARRTGLSEKTLDRWLKEYRAEPKGLRWRALRAYLPAVEKLGEEGETAPSKLRFRFTVLRGDVIHPMHRLEYDQFLTDAAATGQYQGALQLGGDNVTTSDKMSPIENGSVKTSDKMSPIGGGDNVTTSDKMSPIGAAENPPLPPCPPSSLSPAPPLSSPPYNPPSPPAARRVQSKDPRRELPQLTHEPAPEVEPDASRVAAAKAGMRLLGIVGSAASELLNLPDGLEWIEKWLEWLPYRQGLTNPPGFFKAAIFGAVDGNPTFREAPFGFEAAKAAHEAAAGKIQQQVQAMKARDRERMCPTTPADPQLADWQRAILDALGEFPVLQGVFSANATVEVYDESTPQLLIRVLTATGMAVIRRRERQIQEAVKAARPDFPELVFYQPGGETNAGQENGGQDNEPSRPGAADAVRRPGKGHPGTGDLGRSRIGQADHEDHGRAGHEARLADGRDGGAARLRGGDPPAFSQFNECLRGLPARPGGEPRRDG